MHILCNVDFSPTAADPTAPSGDPEGDRPLTYRAFATDTAGFQAAVELSKSQNTYPNALIWDLAAQMWEECAGVQHSSPVVALDGAALQARAPSLGSPPMQPYLPQRVAALSYA